MTSTVLTFPSEEISFWNINGSVALLLVVEPVAEDGGMAKVYAPIT